MATQNGCKATTPFTMICFTLLSSENCFYNMYAVSCSSIWFQRLTLNWYLLLLSNVHDGNSNRIIVSTSLSWNSFHYFPKKEQSIVILYTHLYCAGNSKNYNNWLKAFKSIASSESNAVFVTSRMSVVFNPDFPLFVGLKTTFTHGRKCCKIS